MILSLALYSITSATVVYSRNGQPTQLTVIDGTRKFLMGLSSGDSSSGLQDKNVRLGKNKISCDDTKLINRDGKVIVDATSISRTLYPETPDIYTGNEGLELRSKGGLVIGNKVLWIFSSDMSQIMSEPSTDVFAVELRIGKDGAIAVGQSTKILGYGRHLSCTGTAARGCKLAICFREGLSLFDTEKWVEEKSFVDGESCTAGDHIYWSSHGKLSRYDLNYGKLLSMGSPGLGYLDRAFRFADQDIVTFQRGLFNPVSQSFYLLPSGGINDSPDYFKVGDLAIGFLSNSFPSPEPGILLDPRYLRPIAMIHALRFPLTRRRMIR